MTSELVQDFLPENKKGLPAFGNPY